MHFLFSKDHYYYNNRIRGPYLQKRASVIAPSRKPSYVISKDKEVWAPLGYLMKLSPAQRKWHWPWRQFVRCKNVSIFILKVEHTGICIWKITKWGPCRQMLTHLKSSGFMVIPSLPYLCHLLRILNPNQSGDRIFYALLLNFCILSNKSPNTP